MSSNLQASAPLFQTRSALLETGAQSGAALGYAANNPTAERKHIDKLIKKYAQKHGLPVALVHRVVRRESTYNPRARNGIHMGLMQLNPATARSMGYSGSASGLLDPETNIKYGVKYLAGAYKVAGGNEARADRLYQTGYYYQAKAKGLLQETGLRN